jgi:hypothetical protein
MQFMFNVLLFFGAVGFLSWQLAIFFNFWLRDAQQKLLRQKFEDWWLTVSYMDKLKLSLTCIIKMNEILIKVFGNDIFSKLAFWRTFKMATGLLIASSAIVGFLNHDKFGLKPWENYRITSESVISTIPQIQAQYKEAGKPTLITNTLPTGVDINEFKKKNPNVIVTNNNFIMLTTNTAAKDASDMLEKIQQVTVKYNTNTYCAIYSLAFFLILIFLNALLCYFALIISRLIIREMIAAARPFSTLALLATNLFVVVNVSCFFLLLLVILEIPIICDLCKTILNG